MFFMFAMVKAIVPRYRYDQLMRLGWKIFLPTSLVAVVVIVRRPATFTNAQMRPGFEQLTTVSPQRVGARRIRDCHRRSLQASGWMRLLQAGTCCLGGFFLA
jgi:hypothetical protein